MFIKGTRECERFKIKLSLGVSSYLLPSSSDSFDSAYYSGVALTSKAAGLMDEENEPIWDFEIKDDTIKFSRFFASILDFEGEERVDLIFCKEGLK
jgi:hypothetical protein